MREQFPHLSHLRWYTGSNEYRVGIDVQGSWSNPKLDLIEPWWFIRSDGPSFVARLTLALGIPLSTLGYWDPYNEDVPVGDYISAVAEHCRHLLSLSIRQEEEVGVPDMSWYRDLAPTTLETFTLENIQPERLEEILAWDLPQLREMEIGFDHKYVEEREWLEDKPRTITKCTRLESVHFKGFRWWEEDAEDFTVDPHRLAVWFCQTLPPQSKLTVSEEFSKSGVPSNWTRQVVERYIERRQLEREESRSTAR